MTDEDLLKGIDLINADAERALPVADRVLGEALSIFRIESSSLVSKDVKPLLSSIRARLMLLHQDLSKEGAK